MIFGQIPPFCVFPFLQVEMSIKRVKKGKLEKCHQLPDMAAFSKENSFFDFYLGWDNRGIFSKIVIEAPFFYSDSDFRKGDSVEIFFDTRDLKDKEYITKFCHHFVFYPTAIEGMMAKEATRFHLDDMHPLCDSNDLLVRSEIGKKATTLEIEIPKDCLYGFDPEKFQRFGFSYRINRKEKPAYSFLLSSDEYKIESNPSLWASVTMDDS